MVRECEEAAGTHQIQETIAKEAYFAFSFISNLRDSLFFRSKILFIVSFAPRLTFKPELKLFMSAMDAVVECENESMKCKGKKSFRHHFARSFPDIDSFEISMFHTRPQTGPGKTQTSLVFSAFFSLLVIAQEMGSFWVELYKGKSFIPCVVVDYATLKTKNGLSRYS